MRWQGWNVRKVGKTKRRSNTRRPIWNEEWSLEVPIRRTGSRLHVEMLDYDMIGADDTMGYVERNALLLLLLLLLLVTK